MIVAVALVVVPVVTPGPSEDGTVKIILNVSFPSTMLSLVIGTFTLLILVPPIIVVFCVVGVKSSPNRIGMPVKTILTYTNTE